MEQAKVSSDSSSSLLLMLLAVLLIPAALGSSLTIFNDGDTSWHLATGGWILDHRAIPHTDPFSFTWAGKPWTPMEWLADVIYASAFRLAGYAGVAAVVTAALMALHGLIYFNARRYISPVFAVGGLIALDVSLIPMMLARPHVLTWPLVALWVWLLVDARRFERAPPLWSASIITLWANLHASFLMGLVIAGAFGLEALVASQDRRATLRQWSLFGLACLAAFCINPHGIYALTYPLGFAHLKFLPLIAEWMPSTPSFTPFFFVALLIVALVIAWKRPKLPWIRWLLLAILLGLALLQVRHQAMFAIVAAMLLPSGFKKIDAEAPPTPVPTLKLAGVAAVVLVVARAIMPLHPAEGAVNPWRLIATVPTDLRSKPVLNSYSMGGPLILAGIRPYIDGRSDMYGDDLVLGYSRIVNGNAAEFDNTVKRWDIRWAIVSHEGKKLRALLNAAGWRPIASDQAGTVYVRPT